jgi:phosphonate transport system substrate-binding protein
MRLLATPVFEGRPYFRAYLIVPAEDQTTASLLQLEGKIFAYADPYSHTGYLVPRYELRLADRDATKFFAKTFFTWGHKKVVRAVADGLADGGYVDSFVWKTLALTEPALTAKTRIVAMSAEYGFPPLVAARKVSDKDFQAMRKMLLGMSADAAGAELLRRLNLDGFVAGDPGWYADVDRMMRAMGDQ